MTDETWNFTVLRLMCRLRAISSLDRRRSVGDVGELGEQPRRGTRRDQRIAGRGRLADRTGEREVVGNTVLAMGQIMAVVLAGVWAVAGSLASRTEDLQSTTAPGQIILFVPYLLAVSGGATIKAVMSMVPIGSAMMMPVRLAEGSVPAWQLAVAVAGNVLAIVVLVRLAARWLYQRTLMRTERKISYTEAFKLAE